MKIISILLMLAGVLMILAYGFVYLLGFAMSFDAPGSDSDPKAWGMRLLMFLPVIVGIVMLILCFQAFQSGHYNRSALLGAVIPIAGIAFWGYLLLESSRSLKAYNAQRVKEAREAELYPRQTYMRPSAIGGTDTVIVWPNRIVAYRIDQGPGNPAWGGPLGDLNESRDTILYFKSKDSRIMPEELDQFVDEAGRKLTEVYAVK